MARRAAIDEVRPVLEEIDKVVDVVDKGLDAVEKGTDIGVGAVDKSVHTVVEEVRTATHWLRNPKTAAVVILAINIGGAGFIGWKLAKRHYTKKYQAELEREVESARKFFGRLNKMDEDGAVLTPEDLAGKYSETESVEAAEALKEYQDGPRQYNKVQPAPEAAAETVESNVFLNGKAVVPEDFDLDEEKKTRSIEAPYIISKDEFMENDEGYAQSAITYFAGDDVLADERDQPIEDVESTVGVDNLSRFGHGSGDKNVVYIRNERTEMDFEISYSEGKFAEEVLGFIEHSDRPVGIKRFREGRGE